MEPLNPVINPSGLPTRLERFKAVCLEKLILKGSIEKLIEKRERLAIRELEHAESELERIKANAADVRAQMEETRLAEVGGTLKSEEAMDYNSIGNLNAAPLSKTADVEGDRPSLLDSLAVKDSTRNSTSFKSAESPILLPSGDEGSVAEPPRDTAFELDPRSEDRTPTIPITEEDGKGCDELLDSQAQRYAALCDERRALEKEIKGGLVHEEKLAMMRVDLARSSLEIVKARLAEIRARVRKANEGEDIPPTVSIDDPQGGDGGDGLESTLSPATTVRPYSSQPRDLPSPSVSNTSIHHDITASVHVPGSSRESQFPRAPPLSSEENQATGSHIGSVYKPRKRLTKKGYKQVERARVTSQEDATSLFRKPVPPLGDE